MFGNSWFKKERPLLVMTGFGGGADGKLVSGAAPQFAASALEPSIIILLTLQGTKERLVPLKPSPENL